MARPGSGPAWFAKMDLNGDGDVSLRDVWFRYAEEAPWTLSEIDAEVPARTRTALVGETGSGKTTLAYLVARLYEPERGAVRIDGTDVRDVTLESLAAMAASGTGRTAATRYPPSAVGPKAIVPPADAARSRMPISPCPVPCAAGPVRAPAGAVLVMVSAAACSVQSMATAAVPPGACLLALVRASCAIR